MHTCIFNIHKTRQRIEYRARFALTLVNAQFPVCQPAFCTYRKLFTLIVKYSGKGKRFFAERSEELSSAYDLIDMKTIECS